jgi:hypothetical protein
MSERVNRRVLNEMQFSAVVGLSYAKVKQMRRNGEVRHLRVGRRVLYLFPEHVEAFLVTFERTA